MIFIIENFLILAIAFGGCLGYVNWQMKRQYYPSVELPREGIGINPNGELELFPLRAEAKHSVKGSIQTPDFKMEGEGSCLF